MVLIRAGDPIHESQFHSYWSSSYDTEKLVNVSTLTQATEKKMCRSDVRRPKARI